MSWLGAAILILVAALALQLGLLAYAPEMLLQMLPEQPPCENASRSYAIEIVNVSSPVPETTPSVLFPPENC